MKKMHNAPPSPGTTEPAVRQRHRSKPRSLADLSLFPLPSSDEAILRLTPDGRIRSANAAAERLFGFSARVMIGQPMTLVLIPPTTGVGRVVGAVATTWERMQEALAASAQKLQVLSGRLVAVQEAERSLIARELHDQIGQILFGLSLTLAMGKRLTGEPLTQNQAQVEELLQDAIMRVRQLSLELRPAMLDDLGLLPALLWHFQRFTEQTHVHVDFKHARIRRRFSSQIETAAYRIVQESLTNVARHAGVEEVRVRLWNKHGWLHVQIEDHGTGFAQEQALTGYASSGLTGMQERTSLLGGRFTLESTPGIGTCILAEFSIADPAAPKGAL